MDGGLEIFATRLAPFNGLADLNRQIGDQSLFGIDVEFGSESAAHLGSNHAHQGLGKIQHRGDLGSQQMRNLRGTPQRKLAFPRLVIRQDAARLHGDGNQTLVYDALLDHFVRRLEGRFQVTAFQLPLESDIIFVAGVQRRGAFGDGLLRIHDRRERFVIHFDQIERVARRVAVGGHYRGHQFAHKANAVARQHGPRSRFHIGNLGGARHGLDRAVDI